MILDYDLIPNIETGLDDTSMQLLEMLYDGPRGNKTMSNGDLIRFVSKKNSRLPYDYENVLPTMAQSLALNLPLLDAQGLIGNWRVKESGEWYSVALNSFGQFYLSGVRKKEPMLFPVLLVNGSMHLTNMCCTAIPPHNIKDIVLALIALMDEPEIEDDELYAILNGPDFPGGGRIERSEVEKFYRSGTGDITIFPEIQKIEQFGETVLQINALPYYMDSAEAVQKIVKGYYRSFRRDITVYELSKHNFIRILVPTDRRIGAEQLTEWLTNLLKKRFSFSCGVLVAGSFKRLLFKELLQKQIEQYMLLLSKDIIRKELLSIAQKWGWDRKTQINAD